MSPNQSATCSVSESDNILLVRDLSNPFPRILIELNRPKLATGVLPDQLISKSVAVDQTVDPEAAFHAPIHHV
jgi:hypothetical protein